MDLNFVYDKELMCIGSPNKCLNLAARKAINDYLNPVLQGRVEDEDEQQEKTSHWDRHIASVQKEGRMNLSSFETMCTAIL